MLTPSIDIAVAVVRDSAGRVLLAERTARQIGAGFWELPGGKIERGETPAQAAMRELAEETGIEAKAMQPLMAYDYAFPTKRVRLNIFDVTSWQGTPQGREGQRLAWADPSSPDVAPVLPSNTRVLTTLALPPVMAIVGLAGPALDQLHTALLSGARLIQLRGENLAPDQKVALARRFCRLAQDFGAKTLLTGSALEASRAGADGLHGKAASLRSLPARPPGLLWSVSVQDADDLARAEALGADLAVMAAGSLVTQPVSARLPVYVTDRPHQPGRAIRTGSFAIEAASPAPLVPPLPTRYRRSMH